MENGEVTGIREAMINSTQQHQQHQQQQQQRQQQGEQSQQHTRLESSSRAVAADQARRLVEKLGAKFYYKNGSTLLHHCIEKPPAYVYVLANNGVAVNIQNSDGDSALHLAVRAGNYGVTQALLQCSADLSSTNKLGQKPEDIAEGPIRDLLMRYKPGVVQAVLQGRSRVLDRLCKHTWCSVGTIVKEGKTLMQLAMSRAEKDENVLNCCRILHDYRNTSEVIHAVLSEDADKLGKLLTEVKGCFVNVRYRDKLGATLLSHAIENDNPAIALLLVEAGCRVNKIRLREHDALNTTVPLCHKALQKGVSLETIKMLFTLQDETEMTEKDSNGNTAILRAIEKDLSDDVILWLIRADRGRCLTHRNQYGLTPRELASQKERWDLVYAIDKYVEEQGRSFSHVYLPFHFCGQNNLNSKQIGIGQSVNGEDVGGSIESRGIAMFEAAAHGDLVHVQKYNEGAFQDKNGYTALTRAVVFNQPEVAKYLCTSRPELKTTADNNNRYPLHYANALPDDQMTTFVRILQERDAEVIETRQDKDGRYPVDYRNLRDEAEIKQMLYDARTLDAYGKRGPPLGDWPPGSAMCPPEQEE